MQSIRARYKIKIHTNLYGGIKSMSHHTTAIEPDRHDRAYRVEIPHIARALYRNPYDEALWATVKQIAGESGVCFLTTPDLAALSMMAPAKVTDSRKYLLAVGLLEGGLRKRPGSVSNKKVWHLSIPDLWPANVAWRQVANSLLGRAEFKRYQLAELKAAECLRQFDPGRYFASPSLSQMTVGGLAALWSDSQYESLDSQYESSTQDDSQYESLDSQYADKEVTIKNKPANKKNQKELQSFNHVPTLEDLALTDPVPTQNGSQAATETWEAISGQLAQILTSGQHFSLFGAARGGDYAGGVLQVVCPRPALEKINGYWGRGLGARVAQAIEAAAPGLEVEFREGAA